MVTALLRKKFKKRFINVGIAEQNLINVSTGLALEGFTVYAYAIAPFLTMRAYEQIRINLYIAYLAKNVRTKHQSQLSHCIFAIIKSINLNNFGRGHESKE